MECLLCSTQLSEDSAIFNPFKRPVILTLCKTLTLRLDTYELSDFIQDHVVYCLSCTQVVSQLHTSAQQLQQLQLKIAGFKSQIQENLSNSIKHSGQDQNYSRGQGTLGEDLKCRIVNELQHQSSSGSSPSSPIASVVEIHSVPAQQQAVLQTSESHSGALVDPGVGMIFSGTGSGLGESQHGQVSEDPKNPNRGGVCDSAQQQQLQLLRPSGQEIENRNVNECLILEEVDLKDIPDETETTADQMSRSRSRSLFQSPPPPASNSNSERIGTGTASVSRSRHLENSDCSEKTLHFPYKCKFPNCHFAFENSNELKTHEHSHTGIKPFSCDFCNLSYVRFANLQKHNQSVHPSPRDRHFVCIVCLGRFRTKLLLDRHELKIHSHSAAASVRPRIN